MILRGTGETTRQMRKAPAGANFVWCVPRTSYAKELAHYLGRDDLEIWPWFGAAASSRDLDQFRPMRGKPFVFDHMVDMTGRQRAELVAMGIIPSTKTRAASLARKIAEAILDDVTDRRGWRQEYDEFDDDVRREIDDTWHQKITAILLADEGEQP